MRLAVLAFVAGCLLVGCGSAEPTAVQSACSAYADLGRHPVSTTAEQAQARRLVALTRSSEAAAADPSASSLAKEIAAAYAHLDAAGALHNAGRADAARPDLDAYFRADSAVEADCRALGHDIGALHP